MQKRPDPQHSAFFLPGSHRQTRNQGWEQRSNRYVGLHPTTKDTTLPTAWFDDRTRILRLQVKDSPSQQLHMELDGLAKRSPMLVPIGKGWQETALQVPETVAEIKLMNPNNQTFLTPDVPLQGAVVVME